MKKTNSEFLQKLKSIHGNDYTPLEEYKGAHTKIKVVHNKCGKEYLTTPDNLYNGGCLECGFLRTGNNLRKTQEDFEKEVKELVGDEYTVIGTYITSGTKIKMRHNVCGNEYYVRPSDFLKNRRCPKESLQRRSKSRTKSHGYFLSKLPQSVVDRFNIIGTYKNARTKVKIQCKECHVFYEALPHSLYSGYRCKICDISSKGETEVREYLNRNNINFIEQWGTDECVNIQKLRFDFAIVENGKIKYLIEYNGRQHYKPVDIFGGEESFKIQQHRDQIKKEYCDKNNIPLFIIRYDENVEEVLDMLIPR